MSLLKLTINRQNNTLVDLNGTPTALPALFQYNVKPMQIQVVDPTGLFNSPYSAIDLSSYSLRVGLWPTPTGSAGGPSSLAIQTTWTWSAANKYFTGSLDLAAAAIESYIGTSSEKTAYFEVTLSQSGNRITLYQGTVTLKAVGDEGTTTAPGAADTYLTRAETQAGFVPRVMENGGVIIIPDANGVYALELGCNTDGSMRANIVTL